MGNISQQQFAALFMENYGRLLIYAKGIVRDDATAEDVVEDVFAFVWEHRLSIDFTGNTQAMLYKAVLNKGLSVLRHRNISNSYVALMKEIHELQLRHVETAYESADKLAESNNLMQIIEQAIEPLPARCQEVFRMSYLQGLHNKEIAQQLNCSQRTIEAHIYKALKLIRVTLKSTLGCMLLMLQLPIR